jgi:hypothetical protein
MIEDKQLMFSEAQAITATANSTNVVDASVVRNLGVGQPLYIFILVTEAFTDTGSDSTVAVSLVTDDNAALSSVATVASIVTLAALTAAGTLHFYRLPVALATPYERYIALAYTVANGNLTTGKITAGIISDIQRWAAYGSGFSIS